MEGGPGRAGRVGAGGLLAGGGAPFLSFLKNEFLEFLTSSVG